ncbi:hypothetical protein ABOM_004792 [Aspergillus bombycis]|uniref:Leucine-rich repeat domain-containing protein n=1 Tax=Aspergillus bombycis TaxID=109264 RepID=A0A1F8A4W3_9EURO|nr:hypothetical protein ABOM_004792 [Aspergillus bombycis]OGM46338.1 hypothetical protein ABOM_004792 [Aspergillus bombycis]
MEHLPNELLISIGEYTQERWCPMSTLRSLTLCSRRLHTVFQPLLYSYISPRWSIRLLRLIIRLWKHPELASQVRHLKLFWTHCENDPRDGLDEDEAVKFIHHALDEIFEPEEEEFRSKWREHLLVPCEEAWLGLLLVRLTHLETIEFGHESSDLMSDILRKAARRQRPFHQTLPLPHLREILFFSQYGDNSWMPSDFLTPFFYFPAVRKIHGGPIGESSPDDPDNMSLNINHSSRPVREFTVSMAFWCCGMLDWLASSTELEHIALVLGYHRDDPDFPDGDMFQAPEFRSALLPFTGTLKTLRLEADHWSQDQCTSNIADDAGPFGSLKEFAVLEDLRMRYVHLVQPSTSDSTHEMKRPLVDILPSSLRNLEVLEIEEDHYPDLLLGLSQLVQYRTSFPRLERITLHVMEVDESLQNSLRHEYKTAGIDFRVKTQVFTR